jgi:tetratricopeptide (TPR) repeat protein
MYLLPFGQSVEHEQTLYILPYQLPVILSGVIIVILLAGTYFLYRRHSDDKRHALVFVGVCWYFLGLAVSSSFIPLPDLMSEHRAYFSSVGFILALSCSLDLVRTSIGSARRNNMMVALVALWCVVLMVMTYDRNKVWESGIHLWSDAVENYPASHRANYNLGVAYVYAKNYSEAVKYLKRSIEIDPAWSQAYEVLGVALNELNRYQEAIEVSIRGINNDPAHPAYYNNLGIAYAETNREEDARQAFSTALALSPGFNNAAANLDRVESFIESSIGHRK